VIEVAIVVEADIEVVDAAVEIEEEVNIRVIVTLVIGRRH
jgi:hypothetical protein